MQLLQWSAATTRCGFANPSIGLPLRARLPMWIAKPAERRSSSFGLLARVSDLVSRQKGGKAFLTLDDTEKLLPPVLAHDAIAAQVACLSLTGRLLVFPLTEIKLQPNGGKGLTLIDLDAKDALVSVAVFGQSLLVQGTGRGGKPKEDVLRWAGLAIHIGKRARKGKPIDGFAKPQRVVASG